jgi:hypothetical protein
MFEKQEPMNQKIFHGISNADLMELDLYPVLEMKDTKI